jgi:hypothetical protein
MTEKPILFSGPMVRAILEGRKTMTRRVITSARAHRTRESIPFTMKGGQLDRALQGADRWKHLGLNTWTWKADAYEHQLLATRTNWIADIGYAVGDTLWVRETAWICPPGWTDTPVNPRGPKRQEVAYKADDRKGATSEAARDYNLKLTPSIHMPRWASRITLRVTAVKVERLQDISETDAKAEGMYRAADDNLWTFDSHSGWRCASPVYAFIELWETINGPGSWDANPWVAAYTFEHVKQ